MNKCGAWRFFIKHMVEVTAITIAIALLWGPLNAQASEFTVLYNFTGAYGTSLCPTITPSGSTLYGTISSGPSEDYGAIFKINADGSGYQVLYSFNGADDGAFPYATLMLSGSTLYGTARQGGTNDCGTIFKINTDGTGYQVLYSFTGDPDGCHPNALTLSGTTLYGTTTDDGTNTYGTIFKINTDGSGYQVLYSFTGGDDGAYPLAYYASLTLSGSTLYGTTQSGGPDGVGTIFKIDTDGSGYQVFHRFTGGDDGAMPWASLTLSGSTLYGTTEAGGSESCGTIFKINTDGSGYQVLHTFTGGDDGAQPAASLTLSGSTLYGTTEGGGAGNWGTIFKINTDGTGYQVLYALGDTDGGCPGATLMLSGTTLYGTTQFGGTQDYGTIFSLNVSPAGGLWQNATPTRGGWYYLSPFGSFYMSSSAWIYHQTLGWLYPVGTSTDSIWFYDPLWNSAGGWWWTSSSFFPWIYSATDSEWLCYDAAASAPKAFYRWFWNPDTKSWETH